MFGILNSSKSEIGSYPSCPRHAHHTVTVQSRLHLYLNGIIRFMLKSTCHILNMCTFYFTSTWQMLSKMHYTLHLKTGLGIK